MEEVNYNLKVFQINMLVNFKIIKFMEKELIHSIMVSFIKDNSYRVK